MIAACDSELIGRTLKEGDMKFHIQKDFYIDIIGDEGLLKKHLETATIANLVGHRSVKCGAETGLIDEETILKIDGVPHAQFVLF